MMLIVRLVLWVQPGDETGGKPPLKMKWNWSFKRRYDDWESVAPIDKIGAMHSNRLQRELRNPTGHKFGEFLWHINPSRTSATKWDELKACNRISAYPKNITRIVDLNSASDLQSRVEPWKAGIWMIMKLYLHLLEKYSIPAWKPFGSANCKAKHYKDAASPRIQYAAVNSRLLDFLLLLCRSSFSPGSPAGKVIPLYSDLKPKDWGHVQKEPAVWFSFSWSCDMVEIFVLSIQIIQPWNKLTLTINNSRSVLFLQQWRSKNWKHSKRRCCCNNNQNLLKPPAPMPDSATMATSMAGFCHSGLITNGWKNAEQHLGIWSKMMDGPCCSSH